MAVLVSGCLPEGGGKLRILPDGESEVRSLGLGTIVVLDLVLPEPPAQIRRGKETLGLVAAVLEAGFGDMAEVIPRVGETPVSPGLVVPAGADVDAWTGTLELLPSKPAGSLTLRLDLCEVGDRCDLLEVTAPADQLPQKVGSLLAAASVVLGRRAPPVTARAWSNPVSRDDYAVTVTARAAASWYGLLPPVPEAKWGDKRADPLTRAGFLDPTSPFGFWLAGRRNTLAEMDARVPLQRAAMARPASPTMLAAEAHALVTAGKRKDAIARWELIAQLLPGDPRFVRDHAQAALDVGEIALARKLLASAPLGLRETRDLLALRVRAADVADPVALDELLALWQDRVPDDPEPVRRRVELRVAADRFSEALALIPPLQARGEAPDALEAALRAAVAHDAQASDREPAIQDLRRGLRDAEAAMGGLTERATSVASLQNAMALGAGATLGDLCAGPKAEAAQASAREGAGWRDAVLDARRAVKQARKIAGVATVSPLLSPKELGQLGDLEARIAVRAREYAVGRAWQRQHVTPGLKRCPPPVAGG